MGMSFIRQSQFTVYQCTKEVYVKLDANLMLYNLGKISKASRTLIYMSEKKELSLGFLMVLHEQNKFKHSLFTGTECEIVAVSISSLVTIEVSVR